MPLGPICKKKNAYGQIFPQCLFYLLYRLYDKKLYISHIHQNSISMVSYEGLLKKIYHRCIQWHIY